MARETVAEEPAPDGGTYRLEWIRCGKAACTRCPHGPYWYRYYRVGNRVVSKYVGRDRAGATTGRRRTGPAAAGAGQAAAAPAAGSHAAGAAGSSRQRLTPRRRAALEQAAAHPRGSFPALSARDEEALEKLGYAASIDDCGHVNSNPEDTARGEHRSHPHFFRITTAGRDAVERPTES